MSEVGQAELVTSKRQAAACNVTPIVVRGRIVRKWLREPPWTVQQLHDVRETSVIPMADYGGPGHLMAHRRDGRKAAAATYAAKQKLMP